MWMLCKPSQAAQRAAALWRQGTDLAGIARALSPPLRPMTVAGLLADCAAHDFESGIDLARLAQAAGIEGALFDRIRKNIEEHGDKGLIAVKTSMDDVSFGQIKIVAATLCNGSGGSRDPHENKDSRDIESLSPEQVKALESLAAGRSVVITGPAGTGKSHVIRRAIERAKQEGRRVGVAAMTGSAALLIGGRTLHSLLGIGLAKGDAKTLAAKAQVNKTLRKQLERLEFLVIDEVSMLDADLCTLISDYLKLVRRRHSEPFGGVQLLLSADFCQLPPVNGSFCFESRAWKELDPDVVPFKTNFRQQGDVRFRELLDRARVAECTPDDLRLLKQTKTRVFPEHIQPTRIYSRNRDVDAINEAEMERLVQRGEATETYAAIFPSAEVAGASGLPKETKLVTGGQVVLTYNLTDKLVNGSRGQVVSLEPDRVGVKWLDGSVGYVNAIEVAFEHERTQQTHKIRYMPLKLAWAITVHKSQGMTLDAVEMDLGPSIFEFGQAYTALSRARSLDSVRVVALYPASFKLHPSVSAFYNELEQVS